MSAAPAPLPAFEVRLPPPDLAPWRAGNTGVEGVWRLEGPAPGPHLVLTSLVHGNEFAGAIVLARLLRGGFVPARGRVDIVFANLAAFDRFDPLAPTASRFIDEDLNRVWEPHLLESGQPTAEMRRARALLPVIAAADVVLDLHTMLWQHEPILLCGASAKGRAFARALGIAPLIVADPGHEAGRRLIDWPPFRDEADPRIAVLLEAGQHWGHDALAITGAVVAVVLRHMGLADGPVPGLPPAPPPEPPRLATVTHAITAAGDEFAFVEAWHDLTEIAEQGTLIARDGGVEIRTPYDRCLLVMPSQRPTRGHTAVRLARRTAGD